MKSTIQSDGSGERLTVAAKVDSGASGGLLAPDIHRSVCRRFAWVALCYSIGYALGFGYYWVQVFAHGAPQPDLFSNVVAALAIGSGLVVSARTQHCVVASRRGEPGHPSRPPASYANLAFVFEIVGAFGIIAGWGWGWQHDLVANLATAGQALGIDSAHLQSELIDPLVFGRAKFFEFLGVTWVGVWVIFFPFLVPGDPKRTLWASILSATTVPVVMLGSLAVQGIPDAARPWIAEYLGNMIVPTYICAGFAVIGSRVVYRLTHDLSKARSLGSYQLEERLGEGGMGQVWKARHRMLARAGAIKIIRPQALGANDRERADVVLTRFEREAQATAALKSPHTIDLYDFGVTDEGDFFYVMELLEGFDLKTLVESHGPVPAERAIFFLRQACHSLAEAHTRGLIHRDVKPANIFTCAHGLEYDWVKVLDFGLVKRTNGDGESQLTGAGFAPGTPLFMSPEAIEGDVALDARTDIYALGCVAYWLVTGQAVFDAESPMAVLVQHVRDRPEPPSNRSELSIPGEFDQVVLECLEKDPSKRPQTAAELSLRLGRCEEHIAPWTSERAEHWWETHAPGTVREQKPVPLSSAPRPEVPVTLTPRRR